MMPSAHLIICDLRDPDTCGPPQQSKQEMLGNKRPDTPLAFPRSAFLLPRGRKMERGAEHPGELQYGETPQTPAFHSLTPPQQKIATH